MSKNNHSASGSFILVVEDHAKLLRNIAFLLQVSGMNVVTASSSTEAQQLLTRQKPDRILADVDMPNGYEFLRGVRAERRNHTTPFIAMSEKYELHDLMHAMDLGASDYLPKPFDLDELVGLVARALQVQERVEARPSAAATTEQLVGEAPVMQEVFRAIGRLAKSTISVLITGESGSGKELVARALHRHSPRVHQPFIALNTAAIPAELLESELFGHERGAFTDAKADRTGRFELADGGTLFLDEIGELALDTPAKLLRVLESSDYIPHGATAPGQAAARLIAATHVDLRAAAAARIAEVRFESVRRDDNTHADRLVNETLDRVLGSESPR